MTSVYFPLCLFAAFAMAYLPFSAESKRKSQENVLIPFFNPSDPNYVCNSKVNTYGRTLTQVEKFARNSCKVLCKFPHIGHRLLQLPNGTSCSDYRDTQFTVECDEDRNCILKVAF